MSKCLKNSFWSYIACKNCYRGSMKYVFHYNEVWLICKNNLINQNHPSYSYKTYNISCIIIFTLKLCDKCLNIDTKECLTFLGSFIRVLL